MVLILVERIGLGQLGHLEAGCLTALRAIRRDYYGDQLWWLEVVGPSILYHGVFDFVAFSVSVLEGNVGFIHPTGIWKTAAGLWFLIGLVVMAIWQVKQEWMELESREHTASEAK